MLRIGNDMIRNIPKVSVIIPTYNCAKYLSAAIGSVLSQTCQDFEIVVVDDGSTDNTSEIVADYLNNFPNRIKYLYQNNHGIACARNFGIKNSVGEYIALLDADDILLPEKLEKSLLAFADKKEIGLVHTGVLCINETGELLKQEILQDDYQNRMKKNLSGKIFKQLFFREAHICTSSVILKKECIDKVGLFDEYLSYLGCEDRDLWLKIAEKYEIAYVDLPLVYYRIRRNSMSKNFAKMLKARYYVIEQACLRNKLSIFTKRKAYSNLHAEISYGYQVLNNKSFAWIEAIKSIKYFPFNIKPYKRLIRILLS